MGEGSGRASGGLSDIDVICNAGAGAGAAAGAIAATFVCPLDVIKTRFQVNGFPAQSGHKGSVIVTTLQQIVKAEGIGALYRGLSPNIIALLPNWAVYFSVYPLLKDILHPPGGTNTEIGIGANVIAAAGAGAATSTNPLWVVKTRLLVRWMSFAYCRY